MALVWGWISSKVYTASLPILLTHGTLQFSPPNLFMTLKIPLVPSCPLHPSAHLKSLWNILLLSLHPSKHSSGFQTYFKFVPTPKASLTLPVWGDYFLFCLTRSHRSFGIKWHGYLGLWFYYQQMATPSHLQLRIRSISVTSQYSLGFYCSFKVGIF